MPNAVAGAVAGAAVGGAAAGVEAAVTGAAAGAAAAAAGGGGGRRRVARWRQRLARRWQRLARRRVAGRLAWRRLARRVLGLRLVVGWRRSHRDEPMVGLAVLVECSLLGSDLSGLHDVHDLRSDGLRRAVAGGAVAAGECAFGALGLARYVVLLHEPRGLLPVRTELLQALDARRPGRHATPAVDAAAAGASGLIA